MKHDVINEWNNAAKMYSELQANSFYANFNKEFVKTLTTNISGYKILDAGCGDGVYSNYFQEQGANVIGCDGSSEMVNLAKTKYSSIQFDIVDLQSQLPYEDEQFDLVFCNLVLMDIEFIDMVISEISRVLKNNGIFIFSIVHPSFFLGRWERKRGRFTHKKIVNYINPCSKKIDFWGTTTHFHRPLSFYLNLFSNNNLLLEKMYEPAIPAPALSVEVNSHKKPSIRSELLSFARFVKQYFISAKLSSYEEPSTRIPLFLFARLVKHSSVK